MNSAPAGTFRLSVVTAGMRGSPSIGPAGSPPVARTTSEKRIGSMIVPQLSRGRPGALLQRADAPSQGSPHLFRVVEVDPSLPDDLVGLVALAGHDDAGAGRRLARWRARSPRGDPAPCGRGLEPRPARRPASRRGSRPDPRSAGCRWSARRARRASPPRSPCAAAWCGRGLRRSRRRTRARRRRTSAGTRGPAPAPPACAHSRRTRAGRPAGWTRCNRPGTPASDAAPRAAPDRIDAEGRHGPDRPRAR